ncbi:MAG: hypothetical protein JWP85_251 [Rhodoglobus sp.]|nr:hypothetical protein [Rhodoglobus sp.]
MNTVILVEGVSDEAAVAAVAHLLSCDLAAHGVRVVAMGGATNIARFAASHEGDRMLGLCDSGEERFFRRALGHDYFVCNADLEDELIRALGPERVERVIEEQGNLAALHTFRNQPAQRERSIQQQLRRFMGTTSGRKEQYARALVEALDPDQLPRPLRELFASL